MNRDTLEALVVTVFAGLTLVFVVYQLTAEQTSPELTVLQEQVEFLGSELASLSTRNRRDRARLTVVEREAEVMRNANRLLRQEESDRQAELNRLQSELDFYRRLAGTGGTRTGLAVYQAELNRTDSNRVFRFLLTLTQNIRRASIVSGRVLIRVDGTLDDRPVRLDWPRITDGSIPEPEFRFKYFEQLDGYITLPEQFSPTKLVVMLEVKDRPEPLVHDFDWFGLFPNPLK